MTFEEKLKELRDGLDFDEPCARYFDEMLCDFEESQIIGCSGYVECEGSAILVIDAGSDYVVRKWNWGTCEFCCPIYMMEIEGLTMYDIVNKHTTHCASLDAVREHIGFNYFEDVVWREV